MVNNKKLFRVTLKGFCGSNNYKINYVVATDLNNAYKIVRNFLDKNDIGFSKDIELDKIELISNENQYNGCGTMLFVENENEEIIKEKTNKKYELTSETKIVVNKTLHRIRALRSFADVKTGDLGGWIESEKNLSHDGNCWVYDNARVSDDARVFGNALVSK